jgi:hypothetical protein
MSIEDGANPGAASCRLEEHLGHLGICLRSILVRLVEVVDGAEIRVQRLDPQRRDRVSNEVEDLVGGLDRSSCARRQLRRGVDTRADDGQRTDGAALGRSSRLVLLDFSRLTRD